VKGEPLESLTDEQLVALTRTGNVDAFNKLARRWESSVYRFTHRTLGNPDDARDVCQEAWIKAYRNIARLREGAKFKSWVHHIALNLCRDRFRSAKVRGGAVSLDDAPTDQVEGTGDERRRYTAAEAADSRSVREVLEMILAELPSEQRTCLVLREYQGFNSEEIADITGVPAATVRTRIFYGLKAIRKLMDQRGLGAEDFR
jgi:RNA polymerase sigma-70 factor (ECF subfamily)